MRHASCIMIDDASSTLTRFLNVFVLGFTNDCFTARCSVSSTPCVNFPVTSSRFLPDFVPSVASSVVLFVTDVECSARFMFQDLWFMTEREQLPCLRAICARSCYLRHRAREAFNDIFGLACTLLLIRMLAPLLARCCVHPRQSSWSCHESCFMVHAPCFMRHGSCAMIHAP